MREIVGDDRDDTEEAVSWLNQIYGILDEYANFFLPMRKVVAKQRQGTKVRKTYDIAKTPLDRIFDKGI